MEYLDFAQHAREYIDFAQHARNWKYRFAQHAMVLVYRDFAQHARKYIDSHNMQWNIEISNKLLGNI